MLVVYDLVESIIEISHYTKDYLIIYTHPHHTCLSSMNVLFICVIILIKYDVLTQASVDQIQKDFWVF